MQAAQGLVDRTDIGTMGVLERGERRALGLQPLGVTCGPRAFGRGKAAAVAEQDVGQTMPGAQEIGANVFAAAQEIARRLLLLGGNVDGGEGAGAIQDRELAGIAAIGFHPVPRTTRDQRRGDDVARDAVRDQGPLELEPAGAGLVATLHGAAAAYPFDEPQDRWNVRRQLMERGRSLIRKQDRRDRRRRVLIEGNDGSRLRHDRPPLYAALR